MAHFAKLGLNSKVIQVLTISNSVIVDNEGIEREELGIEFLHKLYNYPFWKQTSYNTCGGVHNNGGTPLRKNFAGIGYTYDEDRDAFIPPKPYSSWLLNEESCQWESPTPYPITYTKNLVNELGESKKDPYTWNESTLTWDLTIV
jgi:hypothetical protein